jgi:predicted dithiol-disulfide oxidoreductase (DUF899 family)
MRIETMELEKTDVSDIRHHKIVPQAEWLVARKDLLKREKELTHLRDEITRHRLELPWVKVEKAYLFDAPEGKVTLAELFDGRSQLFVKHFMMGPGAAHQCVGCSLEVDHVEGFLEHLENHDVTYVAVARAPIDEFEVVRKRMGWRFPWVSSYHSDFNYDFHVSFRPEESQRAARSTISKKRRNGQSGSKTFPATASSTRTSQARSSIPTQLMAEAGSNFSAFTDTSTSCRRDEMRTGHTIH